MSCAAGCIGLIQFKDSAKPIETDLIIIVFVIEGRASTKNKNEQKQYQQYNTHRNQEEPC